MKCRRKDSVTHIVGLSVLKSILIDDGVGARGKWRGEDDFLLKDPVSFLFLHIRLFSGCLSLDIMIVRRESRSTEAVQVCYSHGSIAQKLKLEHKVCRTRTWYAFELWNLDTTTKAPLTPGMRVPYSLLWYLQSRHGPAIDTQVRKVLPTS